MAMPDNTDRAGAGTSYNNISQLRNLARQHLVEIDRDIDQEAKDEQWKTQDLDHYAKHKRQKGSKVSTACDTPLPT